MSKRGRARAVAVALCVSVCAGLWAGRAVSQSAPSATPSVELPPVAVDPKRAKQAQTKKQAPAPRKRVAAPKAPEPSPQSPPPRVERATGPVDGIVAGRSATGTKTDTPLIETPSSISVITAARIEQQGVTSVTEALGYTAGVSGNTYGADMRFDWLRIRGFDTYLPGYFVDGMLARNNSTWTVWKVEPYGAERIEVLKGPASVLYGQTNVGGIVNVVSKRPLEERLNEVGIRIGNHKRLEGVFDFSGPVTKDGTLLYRLTGVGLTTDTQVDFTEQKRVYIAPAFTWRPNMDTSLTVLAQYLRERDVADNRFLPAEGTLLPNPNGKIRRSFFTGEPGYDKFHVDQWSLGYLFEHRFDSVWQVRQAVRYREMSVDYKTVYGTGLDPLDPSRRSLTRQAFTTDETLRAFTTDNQLQGDFVTGIVKHTVLAGLDYQNNVFGQRAGIGGAAPIDMYAPVYGASVTDPPSYIDATTTLSQTGLYLQEQAKIAERWIVILGGRQDWAKNHTVNRPVPGIDGSIVDKRDQAFTWKAGLLYHAPIGVSPYFTYSESFFPSGTINPDTRSPFDPETGQQYEVGIKFQPFGPKSLFTVAAFDIRRQNYVTNEPGTFIPRATGEIHSRGVEFEAVAELAEGLKLIAAYTWLPTFEITKSANPAEIGKREPTVPEHMASLWLHQRLGYGPLAGFGFGGGVRYVGETFGNIANSADWIVPSYTLFDAVIDYEKDGWRYALNVRNIADKTTLKCWDTCYTGEGRSIIASARKRW
jgi:iron complex outermembrane recepter protein